MPTRCCTSREMIRMPGSRLRLTSLRASEPRRRTAACSHPPWGMELRRRDGAAALQHAQRIRRGPLAHERVRPADCARALQSHRSRPASDCRSRVGSGGAGLASLAEALIATAESYIGTPFRRGGSSPSGFDSWGFVRFVFGRLGVTLPSQQQQSEIGSRVRPEWRALAPGDLVLFDDERGVEHVAIYAGRSRIIHAAESAGVRYDDVSSDRGRWYHDHLAGARRLNAPARKRQ